MIFPLDTTVYQASVMTMLQSSMLAGVSLCACVFEWDRLCSLILWTCRAQQKSSNLRSLGRGLIACSATFLLHTCISVHPASFKQKILHFSLAAALASAGKSYVLQCVEAFPVVLLSISRHTVTYILQHQLLSPVTLRYWGSTCSLCFVRTDNYLKCHPFRLSYHSRV